MTYSYTTASKIGAELRVSTEFSASTVPTLTTVNEWITEESEQINKDSARVWGSTEYTDVIDYNGEDFITLKHTPIISVSNVLYSEYALGTDSYGLTATKTEDTDYTVDKERGIVRPLFNNWSPKDGLKRISITYTAGYATTPLIVQKLASKKVALRVLNSLIFSNVNEGNDGGSVSVGSISIVEPASYGVNSYKQLQTDIQDLEKDISKNFGVHRYNNYY